MHCSSWGINSSCKAKLSKVICNMDFSLRVIRICSVSTFSLCLQRYIKLTALTSHPRLRWWMVPCICLGRSGWRKQGRGEQALDVCARRDAHWLIALLRPLPLGDLGATGRCTQGPLWPPSRLHLPWVLPQGPYSAWHTVGVTVRPHLSSRSAQEGPRYHGRTLIGPGPASRDVHTLESD